MNDPQKTFQMYPYFAEGCERGHSLRETQVRPVDDTGQPQDTCWCLSCWHEDGFFLHVQRVRGKLVDMRKLESADSLNVVSGPATTD